MPIQTSDLLTKYSVKTGSAGNSTSGSANASLGKYISTTEITDETLNNLFDDISGDENAAGTVDYRCFFIHNNHGSLTWQNPKIWISGVRCSVEADDDIFTATDHGFVDGDMVRLDAEYNTDTLPTGVNNSTTYYVIDKTDNTFKLSTTNGGSAVNITADGTATVRKYGYVTIELAIDDVAASAIGSSSAQAAEITNETTTPTGVGSFSSPTTKSTGLSLGSIPAGYCKAVWVKRTALNVGARNNDSVFYKASGDSAQ